MKHRISTQRAKLCLFITAALASAGAVGQSTTGGIAGQVAAGTGDMVSILSSTGQRRDVPVDTHGRYAATQLPLGVYTVTLKKGDTPVDTRDNVGLKVGAVTEVSFDRQAAQNLAGVTISANALPPIDVTAVDSRTVITAEQLRKLPLGFSAEAAAQLAPGVVNNSAGFTSATGGSLVSFGGAGANENAYYINGFNTTDQLKSEGGLTLPYGSIEQEEVYTGGYSAQYGRSDGGVINMVGKRGTNDWHFGGRASWEPQGTRADAGNVYYNNGLPPDAPTGALYQPSSKNNYWVTTYDAYVSGPLIKDKLFFFLSGEMARQDGQSVGPYGASPYQTYSYKMPKWYGKLDWNITDSNILEVTGASNKRHTSGDLYGYDFDTEQRTDLVGHPLDHKTGGDLWTAKYTSYLTDSLTLSAMYGKLHTSDFEEPVGYDPNLTYVGGISNENPAYVGGTPRYNDQTISSINDPGRANHTTNLRVSLEYRIGDHTVTAGIDNLTASALNQGGLSSGPGYTWTYAHTTNPNNPLNTGLGVGAPSLFPNGDAGYYVTKGVYSRVASVRTTEHAQYLEDNWQATDRLLLSIGLRDDQFTNYNAAGKSYIKQRNQWAPRLGAAWDVDGDASFKVFANAGRYFLASPLEPALSAGSGSIQTTQYFTYGGINADGTPSGLTAMSPPVSANNQFGQVPDAKTVTAKNLKSMYQDEYMLGFSKTLGSSWVYGAKATKRSLRSAIDDFCDVNAITNEATLRGYDVSSVNSCYLINAGHGNTFVVKDGAGAYHDIKLTREEMGFPRLTRNYYSLETFLEHPFDGKWYGRLDYVLSRSYGNTEGMTQSDVQSDGPQESADWDNASLMVYSNGDQGNDHRHQIKAYGYYQLNREWLVSGTVRLQSGNPKVCLGLFPGFDDPAGYGSSYHYCDNRPTPPGSTGRLPWMHQLDLGVQYSPAFAAQRLGFHLDIFNALNSQVVTNIFPNYYADSSGTSNALYGTARLKQAPRYARFSVTYDY